MFFDSSKNIDAFFALLSCGRESDAKAAALELVEEAEHVGISGDMLYAIFGLRLAASECAFARTCEMGGASDGSISRIAARSLWSIRNEFLRARDLIAREDQDLFDEISNYVPCARTDDPHVAIAQKTARDICSAKSPNEAIAALKALYSEYGAGVFFMSNAFRWNHDEGLIPASEPDHITLDMLSGYERQKELLRSNTEHFISGATANNVLLHGDSGTGKSTSVRALLNEPGYTKRGLRMIEISKDQFRDIPRLLSLIRGRRYRFIVFMDDLSFEEFEVEYKYLKALIEGGVEPRPSNVIVCATSNRRNLIREVWADRRESDEDVHGRDTMQEKLSLADRFGLSIWYGPSDKMGYLEMIRKIASSRGVEIPEENFDQMALKWEIERGGFTGRTAAQFVDQLAAISSCRNKNLTT